MPALHACSLRTGANDPSGRRTKTSGSIEQSFDATRAAVQGCSPRAAASAPSCATRSPYAASSRSTRARRRWTAAAIASEPTASAAAVAMPVARAVFLSSESPNSPAIERRE
eukprot:Amastigsp_a180718_3.p4 type:complete len:112 gc:universal Amastigsp_a180718_3:23-358(+)